MVQLNMYNSDKFKSLNSVTLMQDVFCLFVLCFKFKRVSLQNDALCTMCAMQRADQSAASTDELKILLT